MPDKSDFNTILNQLKDTYIAELPGKFDELESIILNIGRGDDFRNDYESLYRKTHSLKGSAGTYGINIISTICHNLEDKLSHMKLDTTNISSEQVNNWLKFVDLMRSTMEFDISTQGKFLDIEKQLEVLRRGSEKQKFHGLIVGVSQLHTRLCQTAFQDYPIEFSMVENGYQALGRLLQEPYHVLITGQQIPMLNGSALIAATRLSRSSNENIKSILLTSKGDMKNSRNIDPDYVIVKDSDLIKNLDNISETIFTDLSKSISQ